MDYPNIKKLLKKIKSNQMNSKILSVHYLRAIACIAVLVDHFSGLLIINGNPIPYLERGAFGVDLFYIITFHPVIKKETLPLSLLLKGSSESTRS